MESFLRVVAARRRRRDKTIASRFSARLADVKLLPGDGSARRRLPGVVYHFYATSRAQTPICGNVNYGHRLKITQNQHSGNSNTCVRGLRVSVCVSGRDMCGYDF